MRGAGAGAGQQRLRAHPDGRRMLRAIDALSEDEREVFDLVRVQGMAQTEAARVLGVSAFPAEEATRRQRERRRSSMSNPHSSQRDDSDQDEWPMSDVGSELDLNQA